jgi:hypothetical protein
MQKPNKKGNRCSTFEWLVEITELGMIPIMQVVEVLSEESDWQKAERHWIKYYRDLGEPLLNRTTGGMSGGWSWSQMSPSALSDRKERQRIKMREISKKYWSDKTPEQRTELMRSRGKRTHELYPDHLREIGKIGGNKRWRNSIA